MKSWAWGQERQVFTTAFEKMNLTTVWKTNNWIGQEWITRGQATDWVVQVKDDGNQGEVVGCSRDEEKRRSLQLER